MLVLGTVVLIIGGYMIGRFFAFSFAYEYMFTGNHTQRMWALRRAGRAFGLATIFAVFAAYWAYGAAQFWPFLVAIAVCNTAAMTAVLQGR